MMALSTIDDAKLAVISPHYDDAVLGCGNLMAGHPRCTVLTVCSGIPENPAMVTDWDRRCGFETSQQAVHIRRAENAAALSILGVDHVELGLLDEQYRQGDGLGTLDEESAMLERALLTKLMQIDPDAVVFPLGLFHADHVRVANACINVSASLGACRWFAYSDVLYRTKSGLMQGRLAELLERGVAVTPVLFTAVQHAKKTLAVAAYSSQLNALGLTPGAGDDAAPELYWELAPTHKSDPPVPCVIASGARTPAHASLQRERRSGALLAEGDVHKHEV